MSKLTIITLLSIIVISSTSVDAQLLGRRASYDSVKISQILADNMLFQQQYPMLQNLPPLSTGMPFDVMIGYIYADSLFKFGNEDSCFMTSMRLQNCWINDTLKAFAKFIYEMQDYNPIIFQQYLDESKNADLFPTGVCNELFPYLGSCLQTRFQGGDRKIIDNIFNASYILKVRINAILDSGTTYMSKHTHMIYKASARVLDTLKGQVFTPCSQPPQSLNKKPNNQPLDNDNYPDICFEFSHWYFANDGDADIKDSVITGKKEFNLIPGQEYIVFLDISSRIIDFQNDYYDLYTEFPFAISIVNGQIRDYDHIWGTSTWLDYPLWKVKFNQLKQRILKGDF